MPETTAPLSPTSPVTGVPTSTTPIPTPPPIVPIPVSPASTVGSTVPNQVTPSTNPSIPSETLTQPTVATPVSPNPVPSNPPATPLPPQPVSEIPASLQPQAQSPETANVPPVPPTAKKISPILMIVVLIVVILAGGGGVFAFLYSQGYVSVPFGANSEPEITIQPEQDVIVSPLPSVALSSELIFRQNKELWRRTLTGDQNKLTTNALVEDFAVHTGSNSYAYFQGREVTTDVGYTYLEPIAVFVSVAGGQAEKIFDLEPTPAQPNSEYVLRLQDLAFSPDGTILAFSSSDTVYLYKIATRETRLLHSQPISDPLDKGLVYSYYGLDFSPDGQRLLVKRGYYEWFEQMVFDLNTNEFQDVALANRGSDVTWLNNDTLVINENTLAGGNPTDEESYSLSQVPLSSGLKTELLRGGGSANTVVRGNNQLFFSVIKTVKTGQVIDDVEESHQEMEVYVYDITSAEATLLWATQDILTFLIQNMQVVDGKLLLTVARDPNVDAVKDIFLFDPTNPLEGMVKVVDNAELEE